jgi:N-carbamoylputrescine amidase
LHFDRVVGIARRVISGILHMKGKKTMSKVVVSAVQIACTDDENDNLTRLEREIRKAARQGAKLIVTQELFEGLYFPQDSDIADRKRARPAEGHPLIARFQHLARDLDVVLPCSFYEKSRGKGFNSLAMIDAGGKLLGIYRKSHIPFGPGYEEKHFFADGDTGPMVFDTAAGKVGSGICWDQWFPEFARVMVLMGAEILIYPTAIGSEPSAPGADTRDHWQRVMQGHAGANLVNVIAANRIGIEKGRGLHDAYGQGKEENWAKEIAFYGSSFITDHYGQKIAEADRTTPGAIIAEIDKAQALWARKNWGVFRDRRFDFNRMLLEPTPAMFEPETYRKRDAKD